MLVSGKWDRRVVIKACALHLDLHSGVGGHQGSTEEEGFSFAALEADIGYWTQNIKTLCTKPLL